MLVEIDKSIFERHNFSDLNRLISLLSWKGRYEMFIDFNAISHLDGYKKLDEDEKLNIEHQYNRYILESRSPDICISNTNLEDFRLSEAITYLEQPVTIIVENSSNDSPFVKAIIRCFDKKGVIIKHLENHWLTFGNAGGKNNFLNYLQEKLRTFRKWSKANHHYLRVFVLMDSDREFPDMDMQSAKDPLVNFLREISIPYHILEKREMENYLPDETIDTIQDNRDFIDAYLRLTPIQKDFFDLEKGFDKTKPFEKLKPKEVQDLYGKISDQDKKIFRDKDLAKKYSKIKGKTFKSEFPKLFHNGTVTKKTLLKRCVHHEDDLAKHPYNPKELPDLVERIAKLL